MDIISNIIEFTLHLDKHLGPVIQSLGNWSYGLLFAIVFAETGLVITPFLPGDSLLFTVGAFAAIGSLDLSWLFIVLVSAAVIGDSVNYAIGKMLGEAAFEKYPKIFKKKYLEKTHKFYEKYGGKTIVIARFVPIVRTFVPFVAGVGKMSYRYFFTYNVVGGLLWVTVFLLSGYFFGNAPLVRKNFSAVIFMIIILSVLPIAMEYHNHRKAARSAHKKGAV